MGVNHRLRNQRLRRGWSLEGAAERLNQLASAIGERQVAVSGSTFGKWERGVQQPRGVHRELLCVLYDATAEELGLYQPAGVEGTLEDMQRRAFLQSLGAVTGFAASVALEPWQRLMAALRQPSRVDRQTIAELEHVTASLEGLESQVSPRALLGPVVGHLNTVAALLQGSVGLTLRRQLCSVAGETAGLAGWLAWDLEDRRAAGAYFRAGIEAAQEAEDRPLGAYLVGSSCVQPAYRERPHARLRRLQSRTAGFAAGDANPSTRAWLVTLEAEAHALAGNEAASLRALDQAERIMDAAGQEDAARRPRTTFFSRAYLDGERGVALSRLGRAGDARQVLETALGSLDPEMVKTRPRLLTAMATAHVQERNIDEACRLGADALELAERQQVTTNLQDVRRLRLDLEPWRDAAAVRELDEQLAAASRT
jgi:transcriptional regulator with XRE-family HTH domain/tetratricopeptide (TPR) repeat protein